MNVPKSPKMLLSSHHLYSILFILQYCGGRELVGGDESIYNIVLQSYFSNSIIYTHLIYI